MKLKRLIAFFVILVLTLCGCTNKVKEVKPTNITATQSEVNLIINSERDLNDIVTLRYEPLNTTERDVSWSMVENDVILLTGSTVKAVRVGTTKVTATSTSNPEVKVNINVNVYNPNIKTYSVYTNENKKFDIEGLKENYLEGEEVSFTVNILDNQKELESVKANGKLLTPDNQKYKFEMPNKDVSIIVTLKDVINLVSSTSVELSKTSLELTVGDYSEVLVATVLPNNTTDNPSWHVIEGNDVVKIKAYNNNAVVLATKAGTAQIKVEYNSKVSAVCEIKVKDKEYPVTGIALDKNTYTLEEEETFTLVATVSPSNATNKEVTWTSSDESVATVEDGVVTALKAGSASIIATTVDGLKTSTCEVTVTAKKYPVTGIALDKNTYTLEEEETFTLVATVSPSNATNKEVTWTSSDESVATVEDGVVTALKEGVVIIAATTVDGSFTSTCEVTVTEKTILVTGVTLDKETHTINVGEEFELEATIAPTDATNKEITWESSDDTIATVTSSGKVTGLKAGTITITATTIDGSFTSTCIVTIEEIIVEIPVTGVTLDNETYTLEEGEDFTLEATVSPADASNKVITWTSSDESVATVNSLGKVEAISSGTAIITVTTIDGTFTATCTVIVKEKEIPVTGISLDKDSYTLEEEETFTLVATILPTNATNKEVSWTSSNENVAIVENGLVTALVKGTAVITVTTTDGSFTSTCVITVTEKIVLKPATSVTLSSTTLDMLLGEEDEVLVATVDPVDTTDVVTWEVISGADVVSLDANENQATVHALKTGSATIKVSYNLSVYAECVVSVTKETVIPSATSATYTFVEDLGTGKRSKSISDESVLEGIFATSAVSTNIITSTTELTNIYGAGYGGSGETQWYLGNSLKFGTTSVNGSVIIGLESEVNYVVITGYVYASSCKIAVGDSASSYWTDASEDGLVEVVTCSDMTVVGKETVEGEQMTSIKIYFDSTDSVKIATINKKPLFITSIEFGYDEDAE